MPWSFFDTDADTVPGLPLVQDFIIGPENDDGQLFRHVRIRQSCLQNIPGIHASEAGAAFEQIHGGYHPFEIQCNFCRHTSSNEPCFCRFPGTGIPACEMQPVCPADLQQKIHFNLLISIKILKKLAWLLTHTYVKWYINTC